MYGSPEFEAWMKYFEAQEWMPLFMQLAIADHKREVTVPVQWPEWFDVSSIAQKKLVDKKNSLRLISAEGDD